MTVAEKVRGATSTALPRHYHHYTCDSNSVTREGQDKNISLHSHMSPLSPLTPLLLLLLLLFLLLLLLA